MLSHFPLEETSWTIYTLYHSNGFSVSLSFFFFFLLSSWWVSPCHWIIPSTGLITAQLKKRGSTFHLVSGPLLWTAVGFASLPSQFTETTGLSGGSSLVYDSHIPANGRMQRSNTGVSLLVLSRLFSISKCFRHFPLFLSNNLTYLVQSNFNLAWTWHTSFIFKHIPHFKYIYM